MKNSAVTLSWSAVEGGSYQDQAATNFTGWSTLATNPSLNENVGGYANVTSATKQFYRLARKAMAGYDPETGSTSGGGGFILSVSPTYGARGTTFTLIINLYPNYNPAPPPQTAPINNVTVGTITGTNNAHASQTQATSSITIPGSATRTAQTVTVIFPGPPDSPTQTVTYTPASGFKIN